VIQFHLYDRGEHRLQCPECSKGPRDKKTLGLTVKSDWSAVARCFRCDFCVVHYPEQDALVVKPAKLIKGTKSAAQHATLSDFGKRLWSECRQISGAALSYLTERKCIIPPHDGDMRWHPSLKHPCGYVGPALIARITDALTGEPISLHRTWVRADGLKADIDAPRLLLGGHRKAGGVIRLWPDEAVTDSLGIAEGIETALSLAHFHSPAWSCIDAGNLAALPLLPGIDTLAIAADNDPAGRAAAHECGTRWADDYRTVHIMTPKTKNDLNDVVKGAA